MARGRSKERPVFIGRDFMENRVQSASEISRY